MAAEKEVETSVGMPQLDFTTFPNQIFWILIFVLLFYIVVRYIIIPRLEDIMSSRQDLINADIQQAEEFNKEAREIEDEIKQTMAEANNEALSIASNTKSQVTDKVDAAMKQIEEAVQKQTQESEKRINQIEKKSKEDIQNIASELSMDLIDKFSRNEIKEKEVIKMISDELKGKHL